MIKLDKIKASSEWFYGIEHSKQINFIDFINYRSDDLSGLNEDELDKFQDLISSTTELIIDELDNEKEIIRIITECGFDKITAKSLYEFCNVIAMPHIDAKIISNMIPEKLDSVIKFIINNVILYNNYDQMSFEEFVDIGQFSSPDDARKVMRFIKSYILDVCNREISPSFLAQKISSQFNIQSPHNEIIIKNIEESLKEMQQAHLLAKVNELLSKLSNILCTNDN